MFCTILSFAPLILVTLFIAFVGVLAIHDIRKNSDELHESNTHKTHAKAKN